MTSRTQVSHYLAGQLTSNRPKAVQEAAAWLVATGRGRQADYLVRDVATVLATDGYLLVQVTTARPLAEPTRQAIIAFLQTSVGATTVELQEQVDPGLIGGVILQTPTAQLDASVRRRLATIVEGAHQ